MGKGSGRGGAKLGKAVKGKSKPENKEKATESEAAPPLEAEPVGAATVIDVPLAVEKPAAKVLNEDIKMLEEYEKLAKLSEAQKTRLKKLQMQEAYNTKINKKLLVNIHRKFMRADKVDQLRKEIEILAQNHEREVDRKDAIIQMLSRDLDDSEEQFQTAQRAHMDKITKYISLHTEKTRRIETEFERDLKMLKDEFNTEREAIIAQHARELKEMKAVITMVEAQEAERNASAKQDHETEREEIRNKNLEGINELRISLENKIEELEKQFDDAHQNYVENTDSANKHFKELQKEDKKLSKIIDTQKRKIERMQANLVYWKKKIEGNAQECEERNAALREQKEAINKHCNVLKGRMKKFRALENAKLTALTVTARDALLAATAREAQAQKILMLAELARKLETEREKVQPFYASTKRDSRSETKEEWQPIKTLEDSSEYKTAAVQYDSALGEDGQPVAEWHYLENFHKKYNKVLLDKLAIAEEKKRLQKENGDLRSILKQYLDGIAVTGEAVDADNPLLIINGRVNLLDSTVRRARPNNIVELTTVVRNNLQARA